MDDLRGLVQRFAREFGFLRSAQAPCGKPMPLSHAHALMILLGREEVTLQKDLGDALGIDKSNVARLCRKMESAGHLTQKPSASDARARVIALTAKGRRVAGEVDAASRERFKRLARGIPDQAKVIAALKMLVAAAEGL